MTKRYLVLGGCGFIGSHVVDRLADLASPVTVLARDLAGRDFKNDRARYVEGDFADSALIADLLAETDVIVHAASATNPTTGNADPYGDAAGNLLPTIALLEAAKQAGGKRLVFFSSGGAVYGNTDVEEISEETAARPIGSYGIVKLAIENYIRLYTAAKGVDGVVLRTANAYGPRQLHFGVQGLISTLLRNHLAGQTTEIWGDGSVVRDYVYISDIVDFFIAGEKAGLNGTYNVGAGAGSSVKDVVAAVERAVGTALALDYKPVRGFDVKRNVLDIAKARRDAKWNPSVSLAEGIQRQFDWMRQQPL